jgi:dTDP-4-dehydrorhamnose reductase
MLFPRVLITGANGLLGQALVRRLGPDADYTVLATARNDGPRFQEGLCRYAPLDVTQPREIADAFEDFGPTVVVNCAALSDVAACDAHRSDAWAVNARAVKSLAKQCRQTGARLVHVSSDFVFNGTRGPYDETARPDPVNYYGRSKLAGENHLREAGRARWALVRTVLLYGPARALGRSNIVHWIVDQLSQGAPLHMVDDQYRTPTYVDDLADGIERIVAREENGIYHLSGPDLVSIYDLACTVADVFDLDASRITPVASDFFEDDVERPARTGFVLDKARAELDYAPRSLEDGLRALRSHRA